jgi:5-methylcytosine-specific restriction endonuclease McrA
MASAILPKELSELRRRFEKRWKNIEEKSHLVGLELPKKELLWQKVADSYFNGFRCEYCGERLLVRDPVPPYKRSFSLDHKTSIWLGGNNAVENFAIICNRCNIIKGTMKAETFKELVAALKEINPALLDRIFEEMYGGRLADKLNREEELTLESALWSVSARFQEEAWIPIICPLCMKKGKTGIISSVFASSRLVCLNCGTEFLMEEIANASS